MTTTDVLPERITLFYREGKSDKVYLCAVEPQGAGFIVTFAYGRRGSTLTTGCKTTAPVEYPQAKRLFDKLVREKTAKGYTAGEDAAPYHGTSDESRAIGILPQLLNPIDEKVAQMLLSNPAWWAQEKFDGKRVLIRKSGDTLVGINRRGLAIALPAPLHACADTLGGGQWALDGEAVGDFFFAFDLLEQACVDLRKQPYSQRLRALETLVGSRDTGAIRAVSTARTTSRKKALLASLREGNREGIVFKRHDALYTPGRPASGGPQLKLKFTSTASCIVAGSNGTKRSVKLELLDGDRRVFVGSVTIPMNMPIPCAGRIIEAKYLYAFNGGSLYQPVYLGPREDITLDACTVEQLKFKKVDEVDPET